VPTRLKSKSTSPGLSLLDEHRLRRSLRRSACSETWVDDQFRALTDTRPDGSQIVYRFHDPRVFPPGGRQHTAMRWCRTCGRYTPANCVHLVEHRRIRGGDVVSATLQCDDCRIGIADTAHAEIFAANPHLRPSSSLSFVRLRDLLGRSRMAQSC
jgi:hypothetical protein